MRYHDRQLVREAVRSHEADAIVSFLQCHGLARAVVAKTMSDLGQIPVCDGVTWPRAANGAAQVIWRDGEPHRHVKAGSAYFRLDAATKSRHKFGGFKHRLFVQCPDCESWVQTGRFHQHAGSAKCRGAK